MDTAIGMLDVSSQDVECVVRIGGGRRRRTIISFMCGMADVATANREESTGDSANADGVNAIQALEWGARFCRPSRVSA